MFMVKRLVGVATFRLCCLPIPDSSKVAIQDPSCRSQEGGRQAVQEFSGEASDPSLERSSRPPSREAKPGERDTPRAQPILERDQPHVIQLGNSEIELGHAAFLGLLDRLPEQVRCSAEARKSIGGTAVLVCDSPPE